MQTRGQVRCNFPASRLLNLGGDLLHQAPTTIAVIDECDAQEAGLPFHWG
jgi:hypothetical protein